MKILEQILIAVAALIVALCFVAPFAFIYRLIFQ